MTATETQPALEKRSLGRRWGAALGALAVMIVAFGLWLAWSPQEGQVQGIVDAREYRVASKVTGRLAEVLVDGDRFAVVADRIAPSAIMDAERMPEWLA